MSRIQKIKRITFVVLSILCVAFIFSQSLLPATQSSKESGFVLSILNGFTEAIGLGTVFNGHIVRKLAHFFEFAVLSGVLFCTYKQFFSKIINVCVITSATYLCVAIMDEFIQLFSDGRACSFKDVLIDFSGGTVTLMVFVIVSAFLNRKNKKIN